MYRISITGLDGCGKGTQTEKVFNYYNKSIEDNKLKYGKECVGMTIKKYHEPRNLRDTILRLCSEAKTDKNITDDMISFYFGLDGISNRKEEINDNADIIIRDRDTTFDQYAYHHDLGTQDGMIYLIGQSCNNINSADKLIYLDIPVELAIERINKRKQEAGIPVNDYFESVKKLTKIKENYEELLSNPNLRSMLGLKDTKIYRVDGTKSIDEVFNNLIKII